MGRSGYQSGNKQTSGFARPATQTLSTRKVIASRCLGGLLACVVVVSIVFSIKPELIVPRNSPERAFSDADVSENLSRPFVAGEEIAKPAFSSIPEPQIVPVSLHTNYELEPRTLDELLAIDPDELHKVDIARVNLLCASGLPDTRGFDIDHAITTLDRWAQRVAFETERHLYRVTDPRYAAHYEHSEARFRAEMLAQVLYQDLGVRYNPAAVGNFSFADSHVAFIHGMIPARSHTTSEVPGGTCASMPVLYVAVGRRLGYPLKLVTTQSHIFVRWDGEDHADPAWRSRFNIETTNGFFVGSDDYYRAWPFEIDEATVKHFRYLMSLNPSEELAMFMAGRGHHARDNNQFAFAARCYENAHRYDPRSPLYQDWFASTASPIDYEPETSTLARALENHRRAVALRKQAFADSATARNNWEAKFIQNLMPNRVGGQALPAVEQRQAVTPGIQGFGPFDTTSRFAH